MFKQFFTTKFLFEINRIIIEPVDKIFLFVGVVALVIAVLLKIAAKYSPSPIDAKYRDKLFSPFLFLSLSEIIWYGARAQYVRLVGSHFVAILAIVVFLWWLASLLWKMRKNYGKEKVVWDKEQVKLKYLPK